MNYNDVYRKQLVERYAMCQLSEEEAEEFEAFYMEHPELVDEIEAVKLMKSEINVVWPKATVPELNPVPAQRPEPTSTLAWFARVHELSVKGWMLTAAALVLVAPWGLWLSSFDSEYRDGGYSVASGGIIVKSIDNDTSRSNGAPFVIPAMPEGSRLALQFKLEDQHIFSGTYELLLSNTHLDTGGRTFGAVIDGEWLYFDLGLEQVERGIYDYVLYLPMSQRNAQRKEAIGNGKIEFQ